MSPLERLHEVRVVAVIRAPRALDLTPCVDALLKGGIRGIEVTMTTPNAIEGIRELADWIPSDAILGVGTVLDAETASVAVAAGAKFVVSPVLDLDIIRATKDAGALSLPGAYTPTEIFQADRAGADVVKVFPASSLGPSYIRELLAPMPHLKLMPTGGVEAMSVSEWFRAGVFAVGAGGSLVSKQALELGEYGEIVRRAKEFVRAAHLP